MQKRAYISVFDKSGIVALGKKLIAAGWEIVSTGKTASLLNENQVPATESSTITGFTELLGGKVKSLHPQIFAPILANETERKELNCAPFSLVVVNLYPFEKYQNQNAPLETLLANIDIGGVSLLRAAAKNFANVAVVCDPEDYNLDFDNLTLEQRQNLALKTFAATAKYDSVIFGELAQNFARKDETDTSALPSAKALLLTKTQDLRYGENPHQQAALYHSISDTYLDYEILNGKEMSYNNFVDATAALDIASELAPAPATVIIKHTNPCAVAMGKDLLESWNKALSADSLSAFGGVIAFTKTVSEELAEKLVSMFLEIIIAPDFTPEALAVLKTKKNLRVIKITTPFAAYQALNNTEIKITPFGTLLQTKDLATTTATDLKTVTEKSADKSQIADMLFAFKIAKHLKSNAIVIAADGRTLGLCGGQTSRVGALEIAIKRAKKVAPLTGAVLASDGFFPATDNIEIAAENGITAIIEPGGSIKDGEVIAVANKYGIAMLTTSIRHFKH